MRKIYYLGTCSTCKRIIKELALNDEFLMREIKSNPISNKELEEMHKLSGSYESLFSRKAMKYRVMGLHEKQLQEADYMQLILEEYTFLKRPVILIDGEIFIGNSKATVAAAKSKLANV
ncbi:MAG: arsenate reductase family protein [Luteibaculum sp.]